MVAGAPLRRPRRLRQARGKAYGERMNANVKALRKLALGYPGTEEGVACEGTALEKRTVKARGKAFVFLGVSEVLLKLGP